jgi:tripartite-type tricarboxylate transporter receptor subunit TctC
MRKRTLLKAAAGSLLAASILPAFAAWPERPIRLITPFPPGGQVDTIARAIGQKVSAALGQPVVVEPRPGAAGSIAASAVARAPKDGYTLLFGTSSMLGIAKYTNKDLPYDPVADFAPVGYLGNVTIGLFASNQSGITSLQQLLATAKENPGKLNFGSPGVGSASHLAGEMFAQRAGIKLAHVPYPSNVAQMQDLVGGRTELSFSGMASGAPFAKDGRTKFIAVASKSRSPLHPDIPALGEVLPGYEAPAWLGIVAPAGTPRDVVDKLHGAIQAALNDKDLKPLLDGQGLDVEPMNPRAFGDKIKREMTMWEEAVRAAGMQPAGAAR